MSRRRVYHGTTEAAAPGIRATGLTGPDGRPPFVTTDMQRAAGYAMRAICLDLDERGLVDQPAQALRLCIVEIHAERDALVSDPADPTDYVLTRCPPAWLHELHMLDVSDQVPPPAEVAEYADLMRMARRIEAEWQATRIGLVPNG